MHPICHAFVYNGGQSQSVVQSSLMNGMYLCFYLHLDNLSWKTWQVINRKVVVLVVIHLRLWILEITTRIYGEFYFSLNLHSAWVFLCPPGENGLPITTLYSLIYSLIHVTNVSRITIIGIYFVEHGGNS